MKLRHAALAALLATSTSLVALTAATAEPAAQPGFTVLPPHGWTYTRGKHFPASLQTWNGMINYGGHNYSFTMVGTNPATTNTTTTVTAYIVPVQMNYTKRIYGRQQHHIFDPLVDTQNSVTIVQNLLNSPLFNNVDWNWGGTDVGTTQYLDGFQRASFWQDVTTNSSYHVVLSPSVLTELKLQPTKAQGGAVISNPFGGTGKVGEMNINSFDTALQNYIRSNSTITPAAVVIFVTDNIYLTSGGCCIGGYHSATGSNQSYMTATYAYSPGAFVFSSDISAFSHEIGEWYDDPLITSNSPCGLLEVGDPLEGLSNYGDFSVTYNSVTWHPQALAMLEYFGAPANFSVNNWLDNQHLLSRVCQNGQ